MYNNVKQNIQRTGTSHAEKETVKTEQINEKSMYKKDSGSEKSISCPWNEYPSTNQGSSLTISTLSISPNQECIGHVWLSRFYLPLRLIKTKAGGSTPRAFCKDRANVWVGWHGSSWSGTAAWRVTVSTQGVSQKVVLLKSDGKKRGIPMGGEKPLWLKRALGVKEKTLCFLGEDTLFS